MPRGAQRPLPVALPACRPSYDQQTNLRVNPNTGALVAPDTNLHTVSSTPVIVALAYDVNPTGVGSGTLYGIDYALDKLAMIGGSNGSPSANGGVVTYYTNFLGPISRSAFIGLDIGTSGLMYASMKTAGPSLFRLYLVDRVGGTASLFGVLGNGSDAIVDIAVLPHFTTYLPLVRR